VGGVGKEQVTKGLSKLSMQLTIPCLLFTTALDCSQNWSDDPCPDLWTSLTRGWPMLLLPLLYVFYVGCLLHSVCFRMGCCLLRNSVAIRTLGAVACARETCPPGREASYWVGPRTPSWGGPPSAYRQAGPPERL